MSTKKSNHHFLGEEELQNIRGHLVPLFRDSNIMYSDQIRGTEEPFYTMDLMQVIADLYNMLHYEVTGESYDYFFHWANKCGSYIDDADFHSELLESWVEEEAKE